ncbi:piezo-type mechanosensitive ion channel component-like, partial [Ctenocephalides felis]|uniref:piezo-type mechanosensitive ion channel component-like n=1 Tax=Ctenocephalides felis TaxID=7515 RepID=UPI000E6E1FB7
QLDIGLERYQTRELFIKLVTPTFFVIISVIQLHYFHKDFLALSDMKRRTSSVGNRTQFSARSDASSAQGGPFSIYGSEPADVEEPTTKEPPSVILERELSSDSLVIHQGVQKIKSILKDIYELTFQALELHMVKIIMFSIMIMCIYEVSAMHILFVLLISLCQIFDSKWQVIVTKIITVVVSVLFILKMIYQIEYIEHTDYDVNCTDSNGEEHFRSFLSNLLQCYIGIIVVTTLNALVIIRQQYERFLQGKPQARPYYMFPGITRADADKDVRHCLKYLANFGYYKFGLEISLIATVGVICIRLDAFAIFYGIWLLVLFGLKRRMASKIWPAYVIFIVVIIPLQYCMVVGFPPSLCIPLPWGDSDILRRTQEFMFLADPVNPPPVQKLICDFLLLVLVCRQQLVFRIEKRYAGVEYPGGSNSSIVKHAEEPFFKNPVPDFISDLRSWLDVVKRILFTSFLWISLATVFLAGSLRVNIFSLGYLIGSFYFLWQGTDLLLRPIPMMIKGWNGLMAFNVSVIVCKAALQIVGCIFIKEVEVHACWAIQLLGIGCIQKFSPSSQFLDPSKCSVPREDIGLAWDGACFAFLILQRKIFKSYYFFHIINEVKAMTMLASRGAELKEELQRKRVAEQEDEEKNILEKIRQKMDRIKANQKRIQGPTFMEKQHKETSHCADLLFGSEGRPRYRKKEPKTYLEAIRSGDYYMFDEFDDIEIDLEQPKSSIDEHEDEEDAIPRRLTISE